MQTPIVTERVSEDVCAPRIEALSEKVRGLKARQLELTDAIEDRQALGPSPDELADIADKIREAVIPGPNSQRKALLQDMVAEIRVQSRRVVIPVFRLPLRGPSREEGPVREFELALPLGAWSPVSRSRLFIRTLDHGAGQDPFRRSHASRTTSPAYS